MMSLQLVGGLGFYRMESWLLMLHYATLLRSVNWLGYQRSGVVHKLRHTFKVCKFVTRERQRAEKVIF
jgi:hypothetical protein